MQTCFNRKGLKQIVFQEIGEYKLREYFRRLRDLGEKARHLLRCSHRDHGHAFIQTTNTKQFIVAAATSVQEIDHQDYGMISRGTEALYRAAENGSIKKCSIAFKNERFITLLNDKTLKLRSHGEGLLLDPSGRLRSEIMNWHTAESRTEEDYLEGKTGIKRRYQQCFGDEHDLLLLIYSYYIPCTVTPHVCAKIINKYVGKEKVRVIVAYDYIHEWSDEDDAFDTMCTINSFAISMADGNTGIQSQSDNCSWDYICDMYFLKNEKHLRKRLLKRLQGKGKTN